MTDKFVCPEPSEAALQAASLAPTNASRLLLRAAYAEDFPSMCRAECHGMIRELMCNRPDPERRLTEAMEWLDRRFPEAAPETSGDAGLDSPSGTRSPSSNAADEAASGRTRSEDTNTPQPSAEPCKHVWSDPAAGNPDTTCIRCGTPKFTHSADPQTNAAGIDIKKFRMSEKGWTCRVCREEIVSPAHPMFHVCVTPSAGERTASLTDDTKRKFTKLESGKWRCNSCGDIGASPGAPIFHACRVPTPNEGERCGVEGCVGHLCVPTPSAGEEEGVKVFVCNRCYGTFTTSAGYFAHNCPPGRGVSAGETKPELVACSATDEGYGCTLIGGHSGDHAAWGYNTCYRRWPAVGARPEEKVLCCGFPTACRKPAELCFHRCTACACETCQKRMDFVLLLADALGRNDNRSLSHRLETYGGALLVEAARRVTA